MSGVPWLPASPVAFPDPAGALSEPDGLLAAGGDLTPEWLLNAYANGIFPWFDDDAGPVLWWSPAQRAVMEPGRMHVSRSLGKRIRNAGFQTTLDRDFRAVIGACSAPRPYADGTWITPHMMAAYARLHDLGFAHSVEVNFRGRLVGGLYGVSLGRMFFGESMFSHMSDASKVALFVLQAQLERWGFSLIDCQLDNPHLQRLGVRMISRSDYLDRLRANPLHETHSGRWCLDQG